MFALSVDPKWFLVWCYDEDAFARLFDSAANDLFRPIVMSRPRGRRFVGYLHHKDLPYCEDVKVRCPSHRAPKPAGTEWQPGPPPERPLLVGRQHRRHASCASRLRSWLGRHWKLTVTADPVFA